MSQTIESAKRLATIFGAFVNRDDEGAGGKARLSASHGAVALIATLSAVLCVLTVSPASALGAEIYVRTATIGAPGSGDGQLAAQRENQGALVESGLAVNESTHDIYVADTGNHRVEEFTAAGAFVRTFGSFPKATFIAVDNSGGLSEGDVYVGEKGAGSVTKFTAEGAVVSGWQENGSINVPQLQGMGVDGAGDLYLRTAGFGGAKPFDEYDQSGALLRTFAARDASGELISDGRQLAVDSEGNLYWQHNASGSSGVIKFNPNNESFLVPDSFFFPWALAIDPTTDDLYAIQASAETESLAFSEHEDVVDHFAANCGTACSPLEEFGGVPGEMSEPSGIAVDGSTQTVYVLNTGTSDDIGVFTRQNVELPTVSLSPAGATAHTSVQVSGKVDPKGHVTSCRFEYIIDEQFQKNLSQQNPKPGFAGASFVPCASQPGSGSAEVPVAAELGDLTASSTYHLRLQAKNGAGTVTSAEETFETELIVRPSVSIEAVSGVTPTTAQLSGHIDPNAPGPAPQEPDFDVAWHFQCTPACPGLAGGQIPGDGSTHEVSAAAAGLLPGTHYTVVLVAANAGPPVTSAPVQFTTPAAPPQIAATTVTSVSSTEAQLAASITPEGAITTYHVAYITESQFEEDGETFGVGTAQSEESESIGAGDQAEPVSVRLTGLQPSTGYRFRFVAHNSVSSTEGEVKALRTRGATSGLPDDRAYELVSTSGRGVGEPYAPETKILAEESAVIPTSHIFEAAFDGEAIAYVGEPPASGGTGDTGPAFGDEWLARHTPQGWQTQAITPGDGFAAAEDAPLPYQAFSPDLTNAFLLGGTHPLTPEVPAGCRALYSRSQSGEYHALYGLGEAPEGEGCGSALFAGATADESQVIFQSVAALTPGAKTATEVPPGYPNHVVSSASSGRPCSFGCNLYLARGGQLTAINVIAHQAVPNASFGGFETEPDGGPVPLDLSNAISTDGSRIFWTATKPGPRFAHVYVFENGSESVQVSGAGPAQYWTATPDGHYAYYTEAGELWRFDTGSNAAERITAPGAGVLGVIGTNQSGEDGAFLYFVAKGKLATNQNAEGQTAVEGEPNLYLIHEGTTRFIATLDPADDNIRATLAGPQVSDWISTPAFRSAEVTPDGTHLIFQSTRPLTGYQNTGPKATRAQEAFVYTFGEDRLACVSCDPAGLAPTRGGLPEEDLLPVSNESLTYMRRWISANGARVFFDSPRSLVPDDPGTSQSVYEWERAGEGSCTAAAASPVNRGCVFLLSGGGNNYSFLVDADADGKNVFFEHVGALGATHVSGGENQLYDARVDGVEELPEKPPCESGEACRNAIPASPNTSSPGSVQFHGSEAPRPEAIKCKKGFKKARKNGHTRCVKVKAHRPRDHRKPSHDRGGHK